MPTYFGLKLCAPKNKNGDTKLPENLQKLELANVGLYINYAIVIGEIFKLQTKKPLEKIDQIYDLVDAVFTNRDIEIMTSFLSEILEKLKKSIDASGKPTDVAEANMLRASDLLSIDSEGRLVAIGRYVLLIDLKENLEKILNFFKIAKEKKLDVKMT